MALKYATYEDKILLFFAMFGTALMASTGPLFAIAWGSSTDDVNLAGDQK